MSKVEDEELNRIEIKYILRFISPFFLEKLRKYREYYSPELIDLIYQESDQFIRISKENFKQIIRKIINNENNLDKKPTSKFK